MYIVYTFCAVLSMLVGSLGPWMLRGIYWNNVCSKDLINGETGNYDLATECNIWHLLQNMEVLLRLPFQINIMVVMYGYFIEKVLEEKQAKRKQRNSTARLTRPFLV